MNSKTLVQLCVTFILVSLYSSTSCHEHRSQALEELHKTTAELARKRGFHARDHFVTTNDGYILNIAQVWNPLVSNETIANKRRVLFIHGFINNGNTWLVNSIGAKPQDYSSICGNATQERLLQLAKSDSGFNSVPITFMNCGYEVWIVNRRGTLQSLGHTGPDTQPYLNPISNVAETALGGLPSLNSLLTSIISILPQSEAEKSLADIANSFKETSNPRYWNFSYDEEAKYDVPEIIDYILNYTKTERLNIVAHSAGGQVILMAQVVWPELAAKIDRVLLYAPSLYLSHSEGALALPLLPILESYTGPLPPGPLLIFLRAAIATVCFTPLAQHTICSSVLQLIQGPDGGTELLKPGFVDGLLDIASSHATAQLLQTILKRKGHFYDFSDPYRNMIAYGQPESPPYDVTVIKPQKLAIWFGNGDTIVTPQAIITLLADLKFYVSLHFIDSPGIKWDHLSYFYRDRDTPKQLTVPSLLFLESD